jgi:hypothetical protein
MGAVTELAFAYVAGLVIGGVVASIMELICGEEPSFGAPFFARERIGLFLVTVTTAGPFMLANDALRARKGGLVQPVGLTCLLATASIWAAAIGVAAMGLALGLIG